MRRKIHRNEDRGEDLMSRLCLGGWGHNPEAWIDLSPGAIAWLFGAANHAEIATQRERDACRVVNDR